MADPNQISKLWALCGEAVTLATNGKRTEDQVHQLIRALEIFNNPQAPSAETNDIGNGRCGKCGHPILPGENSCGNCNREG